MIYTHRNCAHGTRVIHVPTCAELKEVESVDTVRKLVVCYEKPIRVIGDTVATRTMQCERIKVVYNPSGLACLFLLDPVEDPDAEVTAADKLSEIYA